MLSRKVDECKPLPVDRLRVLGAGRDQVKLLLKLRDFSVLLAHDALQGLLLPLRFQLQRLELRQGLVAGPGRLLGLLVCVRAAGLTLLQPCPSRRSSEPHTST